ncbi:MAG: hypothetical protein GY752_11065, partial [bacterium]|nr:hypothetical protein [bacterium]
TMAYFTDTSGVNIDSATWVQLYEGGNHTSLDIYPLAAPGTSQVGVWDFPGTNGTFFNWIDATDTGELDINDTGIHAKSGPNDSFINVVSKSATGTAVIKLIDSSDADKFTLQYTESTDALQIDATEDLDFNMSSGAGVNIVTASANTKAPLALESTGTGGASNSIFLSDVTPIGAIPGSPGD